MTDYSVSSKVGYVRDAVRENGVTLKAIVNSLETIALNMSKITEPAPVFNVYVRTGGTDTTRDVAKAVREAMDEVTSRASV